MESDLSVQLQKYYLRQGNRIIFSNGYTVTQLAWEMWERLGYKNFDPSTLSKVLNGYRLFTSEQLEVFCEILQIDDRERNLLFTLLAKSRLAYFGFEEYWSQLNHHHLLDNIDETLKRITQARQNDASKLAFQWLNGLQEKIQSNLNHLSQRKLRNKLVSYLGEVLLESRRTFLEIRERDASVAPLYTLFSQIQDVGEELQSANYIGNAYATLSKVYLLSHENEAYIKTEEKALQYLEDPIERCASLSHLTRTYAKIHAVQKYKSTKKHYLEANENCDISMQCYNLQSFALAQIHLGNFEEALKTLEGTWKFFNKYIADDHYANIRRIQLLRTEIYLQLTAKGKLDNFYRKKFQELVTLASTLGYNAYKFESKKANSLISQV